MTKAKTNVSSGSRLRSRGATGGSGGNTPQGNPATGRLYTGLFILAAVLLSILALWKPFTAPVQFATVVPKGQAKLSEQQIREAVKASGVGEGKFAYSADGTSWNIRSQDPKAPVSTADWQKLATDMPTKLKDGTLTVESVAPTPINLGLDLKGGLRVLLEASIPNPTEDDMERVRTIIENRVNGLGIAETVVQKQGNRRLVVEIPGLTQAEQDQVNALIGQTAKLEFRIVKREANSKNDTELTDSDMEVATVFGDAIANALPSYDRYGRPQVDMTFSTEGNAKIETLTGTNIGRRMAIVLDGKVQSAPNIQARLSLNGVITGVGTVEDATNLALVLKSGALPFKVNTIEKRAIGPTLGADAIRQGFFAAIAGIGLIFVLLFVYYGFWFGLVAALGLIFSAITIFGMLAGLGAALTLPGIAGLVLTIGAAVDGNVISFERIKEELHIGKGIKQSIKAGFGHSFATIMDVNLSHLLSAMALYSYSTGPVKGFAVTLAVGVVASTFSNIIFSRWMMELLSQNREIRAPQWFSVPKFDFMGLSKFITTASVLMAIVGGGIILVKGFNFSVDFKSGTAFTFILDNTVSTADVRAVLDTAKVPGVTGAGATIVETQTPGTGREFVVKVGEITDTSQLNILRSAFAKLPGGGRADAINVDQVGPSVGNELRTKTIEAVLIALALTLIYVAFRFDPILGVGSMVAVAHDVAIVMGVFALLEREFSLTMVAAVLTLIGYSLNDSIIVADRIRENLREMRGQSYSHIVNTSINQTLSRTIMTSVSTALPLIALFIFGGSVLRDFSLALLIGILVGTYSSIYIVAPMAVYFKDWQAKNSKKPVAKPA
jgi:SecD/SecF fusion protein